MIAIPILVLPLLAACAGSAAEAESVIIVRDPWARSEHADQNSAAYMQIVNEGDADDTLIAARAEIAVSVEVHQVTAGDGYMTKMHEVDEIEIPAGERVDLEPGGLHVMFFGLYDDLEPGDTFTLTLEFASAGEIEVTIEVREHSSVHGG